MRQHGMLDPDDWQDFRALGHRLVDEMALYLQGIAARPVFQPVSATSRQVFSERLPREAQGLERTYEDVRRHILSTQTVNLHPRFWGWVVGTGRPANMLSEMLAGALDANVGAADQAPVYVEMQLLQWLKEMLDYPPSSSGLLVSGGSMANLTGLAVARNAHAPWDVRQHGVHGARRLVIYASTERHNSIDKAVELLGIGRSGLRLIPVDREYRMDVAALQEAIRQDRTAGHLPLAVVGNAGTVNTGAFDDLNALADVARAERLWLHVDGAFGALAALTARSKALVHGMDRADSLAFDLHKWLHMPYGVGCMLVRDPLAHARSFALQSDYLDFKAFEAPGGPTAFDDLGLELSRPFRALSLWMALKEVGVEAFAHAIDENLQQAQYLVELIRQEPRLELTAPVPLNIVCFRYRGSLVDPTAIADVNNRLVYALAQTGSALVSTTQLAGALTLRVSVTNHRSRFEDFDLLVSESVRLGDQLAGAQGAPRPPGR